MHRRGQREFGEQKNLNISVLVYVQKRQPCLYLRAKRTFIYRQSGGAFIKIAALHLLNQFGSEILLRVLFVLGRREAGFHCPEIFAFTNQWGLICCRFCLALCRPVQL
jgi:hypothetical protein